MTKVIKKWFVAILACFTVFLVSGICALNPADTKKVSAEGEVSIGISRVYFLTGQDPSGSRPPQQIYDIVFDYEFPERGSWATVSGVLINGVDVAREYSWDTGLSLAEEVAWADPSCSSLNTFRMYIYGQVSMHQLTFTEEFKFEINGTTYKLDREYDFSAWATQAYYGAWDGLTSCIRLSENVPVEEKLPEVNVTGVEFRGFRDNDFLIDITFDKDLQKSESSFFMDNVRVNGQEPYIGSVGGSNTRYYPYAQYAEETANRVRLFLNAKAADYGFIGNNFNSTYTREINTFTILKGFKVVLADGTVAQVKADANYVALATITSGTDILLPENVLTAVQNVLATLHTEGASIKVKGIQGLRFMNVVDADAKAALDAVATVTYGTILSNSSIGTADVKADTWYDEAQTQYTATIKGFSTNEHYNLVFTATAYIDVQLASGKVKRFNATTSESRSIAYVANAAINDYQTSYNEANGYVYEVEAGKFYKTDYTTEQLSYLRNIAATYVA